MRKDDSKEEKVERKEEMKGEIRKRRSMIGMQKERELGSKKKEVNNLGEEEGREGRRE